MLYPVRIHRSRFHNRKKENNAVIRSSAGAVTREPDHPAEEEHSKTVNIRSKLTLGAALPALALVVGHTSYASSHREAPTIADDPAADNTDTYAWLSTDGRSLNVVANWIPLEEPAGGPNFHKFSSSVRYEIHI